MKIGNFEGSSRGERCATKPWEGEVQEVLRVRTDEGRDFCPTQTTDEGRIKATQYGKWGSSGTTKASEKKKIGRGGLYCDKKKESLVRPTVRRQKREG